MLSAQPLVSIGLPVRNAGGRVTEVVSSVLSQDYEHLELVISDNASTDNTEAVCRELAAGDSRIVYRRQRRNVGILENFVRTITLARGELFRWIGDDDRLEPAFASECVRRFADDPRLVLVTTGIDYTGPDGVVSSASYPGTALGSDDPATRFIEMLRLLNESYLLLDPLYAMLRREPVAAIPRRNMLHEDEVFAAKLALVGPWGHVPTVLAHRRWKQERLSALARRLGVAPWRSHVATTLQCQEMLRWLRTTDLTPQQLRRARSAVYQMHLRRGHKTFTRRGRKVIRVVTGR
jgi:glycosyltransferase involved in cell wall biosynthesis